MTRRKSKLSSEECKRSVESFFQKQKKFKQIQSRFGEVKAEFYNDMEDYFECNNIDGKLMIETDDLNGSETFTVTRIQSSKIEFSPDKLEKALGKELSKRVIQKQYEIIDIEGLVSYLKEYGVDPKTFKSFLSIKKTVDAKELDKLEELGKITIEQVKGCYTVKKQNPYFTVNAGKGQG